MVSNSFDSSYSLFDSSGSQNNSLEQYTFNFFDAILQFPKASSFVQETLRFLDSWSIKLNRTVVRVSWSLWGMIMERMVTTSARQMTSKGDQKKLQSILHFKFFLTVKEMVCAAQFLTTDISIDFLSWMASFRLNCSTIPSFSSFLTNSGSGPQQTVKSRSALISAYWEASSMEMKFLTLRRRQQGMQQTYLSLCRQSSTLLVQPYSLGYGYVRIDLQSVQSYTQMAFFLTQ